MPSYNPITKLSELDANVPTGSEPFSNLDNAIRQTRDFIKTFLGISMNDDGTLKDATIAACKLAAGAVRGSTSAGVQREILQESVTNRELAPGAVQSTHLGLGVVSEANLADTSVSSAKIIDSAVTEGKLATSAVTAAKIAAATITKAKMANNSVGTDQIESSAITDAKIASATITPAKVKAVSSLSMLVGDGTKFVEYLVDPAGAMSFTISGGKILFGVGSGGSSLGTTVMYALLQERQNKNVAGGSAGATTWNQRNSGGAWSVLHNPGNLVELDGAWVKMKIAGDYLIRARGSVYSVGIHKAGLFKYAATPELLLLGTSGYTAASEHGDSFIEGIVTLAVGDKITLYHYTDTAQATNGLGYPSNINDPAGNSLQEVYGEISLIKL